MNGGYYYFKQKCDCVLFVINVFSIISDAINIKIYCAPEAQVYKVFEDGLMIIFLNLP